MVYDIFRCFNLIEYVYENLLYFTYMNYNNPDLRILNITHSDMDGIACSIVLKNFYKTVHVLPTNYNTEWKLADDAKAYEGKYDIIICTDFCPTKAYADLCKLGHVLVIDHHESVMDRNNNETIVINTQWSATALVYKFISKFKNISYLDNFVKLVDDWDMFRLKDPRSPFFNNMFWEMGNKWFLRRFIKGNLEFYPEEKQYFVDSRNEFKEMYETLEIIDLAQHGVFFETDRFMHDCIESLKKDGYKWFIIKNKSNLSVRCDDIDLTDVFKKLGKGGGHVHAGGLPLYKNDNVQEIIEQIERIIDAEYRNLANM